jgi:hypothetical protein
VLRLKSQLNETQQERRQCGQGIIELILVVPLILILVSGIHRIRDSLTMNLAGINSKLNDRLSINRVPHWQRAHWKTADIRQSASTAFDELPSSTTVQLEKCNSYFNRALSTDFMDEQFLPESLQLRLDHIRMLSLSLARAACVAEAIPSAGQASAPLLVTGFSTLPNESIRKEGFSTICPIISRTTERIRSAVIVRAKVREGVASVKSIKAIKSWSVVCLP